LKEYLESIGRRVYWPERKASKKKAKYDDDDLVLTSPTVKTSLGVLGVIQPERLQADKYVKMNVMRTGNVKISSKSAEYMIKSFDVLKKDYADYKRSTYFAKNFDLTSKSKKRKFETVDDEAEEIVIEKKQEIEPEEEAEDDAFDIDALADFNFIEDSVRVENVENDSDDSNYDLPEPSECG
jgi:hypothetical protein